MENQNLNYHLLKLIKKVKAIAKEFTDKVEDLERVVNEGSKFIIKDVFVLLNKSNSQQRTLLDIIEYTSYLQEPTNDTKENINKYDSKIDINEPFILEEQKHTNESETKHQPMFITSQSSDNVDKKPDEVMEEESSKCNFLKELDLDKRHENKVKPEVNGAEEYNMNELVSVTFQDVENSSDQNDENSNCDGNLYDSDKYEEALKALNEDNVKHDNSSWSSSDVNSHSDSDVSENENNSLTALYASTSDHNTSESSEVFEKKDFKLKECYVKLIRLSDAQICDRDDSDSTDVTRSGDDVDRICNLNNIKKTSKGDCQNRAKFKKRRKILSSSESESDADGSSPVENGWSSPDKRNGTGDEDFCPNLGLLSDSDSEYKESDKDEVKDDQNSRKTRLSQRKVEVKADKNSSWKNNQLLREKFSSAEESDAENDGKRKRKNRKSSSSESDTQKREQKRLKRLVYITSDDSESDSKKTNKSRSSDSSSEVWDLDNRKEDSSDSSSAVIKIEDDSDDPEPASEKNSGRKNIRPVLSSKDLTEETQKAAKDEEERVQRLEMKQNQMILSQEKLQSNEDGFILDLSDDGSTVAIDPMLSKMLYSHQIKGVEFMWNACYESMKRLKISPGSGCILAHCMGLGKTFQVVTLVLTLFKYPSTNVKRVVVVCPISTIEGWKKEFKKGQKNLKNKVIFSMDALGKPLKIDERANVIESWSKKKGVLLLGYEAFEKMINSSKLSAEKLCTVRKALLDPGPDLIVCDEGHLLKSGKTLKTKALMQVKTKRRIVLTGTPLQNNLTEYYHMVQFVKPNLLGTFKEYSRQFSNPILNGQYEDSNEYDIKLMKKRTHVLHRILRDTVQRFESVELSKYLKSMKDYVLFIQLHPIQESLYKKYLEFAYKKQSEQSKMYMKCLFHDYQVFKYISSHPKLLEIMEKQSKNKKPIREYETIDLEPEVVEVKNLPKGWWREICPAEIDTDLEVGTKFKVLFKIIEEAEKRNDKVLVFTSSLIELEGIEHFLKIKGTPSCPSWKPKRDYFRMDGTVPPSLRATMCDCFNDAENKTLRLFLMSHKVGGLGLNLVAANRVVLLGANFNPCYDQQSIYRAYRFGQKKNVSIYRLISMGTMEERIYNRCVTKLAIARRVVDKHQITRHYKTLDLSDLYQENIDAGQARFPLSRIPDEPLLANVLCDLECVFKYHEHEALLQNRPDEELNEEDQRRAWEEFKTEKEKERLMAQMQVMPEGVRSRIETLQAHLMGEIKEKFNVNIQDVSVKNLGNLMSSSLNPGFLVSQANSNAANKLNFKPGSSSNASIAAKEPVNKIKQYSKLNATVTSNSNNVATYMKPHSNLNNNTTVRPVVDRPDHLDLVVDKNANPKSIFTRYSNLKETIRPVGNPTGGTTINLVGEGVSKQWISDVVNAVPGCSSSTSNNTGVKKSINHQLKKTFRKSSSDDFKPVKIPAKNNVRRISNQINAINVIINDKNQEPKEDVVIEIN